jgi:hypothetical protein
MDKGKRLKEICKRAEWVDWASRTGGFAQTIL